MLVDAQLALPLCPRWARNPMVNLIVARRDYIARRTPVDYALYTRYRGKLQM